jgi:hypothetical protein
MTRRGFFDFDLRWHANGQRGVLVALCALLAALNVSTLHASSPLMPDGSRYNTPGDGEGAVSFRSVGVYVDPQGFRLGAYQVLVMPREQDRLSIKIVGITGGEGAYDEPPAYDPAAIGGEAVILASYSLDTDRLPRERVRVASINVRVQGEGEPEFEVTLQAAAGHDGRVIEATAETEVAPEAPPRREDRTG